MQVKAGTPCGLRLAAPISAAPHPSPPRASRRAQPLGRRRGPAAAPSGTRRSLLGGAVVSRATGGGDGGGSKPSDPDENVTESMGSALGPRAIAMWTFYAAYMRFVMLGSEAPGTPAQNTTYETLLEVLHESANFFYVNIFLHQIGITLVPNIAENPLSEALFNFVNAWSMMMLPLFLIDRKSENMPNKIPLWFGTQFLTNIFCIIYMAYREQQTPRAPELPTRRLPVWTPLMGVVAVAVGLGSLYWAAEARPEYGDLEARLTYLHDLTFGDRVFFAFVVDSCIYCVWQAVLMQSAPAKYKFVPFFGLAAWLITREQIGDIEDDA